MKTQMEALIYHFKIVTEGFTVPEGEVYMPIESPRGEMGYYVVSDGTAKPYRVHMVRPRLPICNRCARCAKAT
jgi:NADH-quinone oxidoreductase subunit D